MGGDGDQAIGALSDGFGHAAPGGHIGGGVPARAQWLEQRKAELLPVDHFHVVFTIPQSVAAIAFYNKSAVYGILFRATAETLLTIARDPNIWVRLWCSCCAAQKEPASDCGLVQRAAYSIPRRTGCVCSPAFRAPRNRANLEHSSSPKAFTKFSDFLATSYCTKFSS